MKLVSADTLRGAFDAAGMPFPDCDPEPGEFVRFPTNGRAGDTSGWMRVFDHCDGAIFGDWRSGQEFTSQRRREGPPPTAVQSARWRAQAEESRRLAEADREAGYAEAARRAADEWHTAHRLLQTQALGLYSPSQQLWRSLLLGKIAAPLAQQQRGR